MNEKCIKSVTTFILTLFLFHVLVITMMEWKMVNQPRLHYHLLIICSPFFGTRNVIHITSLYKYFRSLLRQTIILSCENWGHPSGAIKLIPWLNSTVHPHRHPPNIRHSSKQSSCCRQGFLDCILFVLDWMKRQSPVSHSSIITESLMDGGWPSCRHPSSHPYKNPISDSLSGLWCVLFRNTRQQMLMCRWWGIRTTSETTIIIIVLLLHLQGATAFWGLSCSLQMMMKKKQKQQ